MPVCFRPGERLIRIWLLLSTKLRAARANTPAIMAQLLNTLPITDLAVEDPPIEAVIDQIYQEGSNIDLTQPRLKADDGPPLDDSPAEVRDVQEGAV